MSSSATSEPYTVAYLCNRKFVVFDPSRRWPTEAGGVYVFARPAPGSTWIPLYVGQTRNLANRLAKHEKWSEAERYGATHIHVREVPHPARRSALESDLIESFRPLLLNTR